MSIKKVLYHIIAICFCSLFGFLLPAFAWQGTVISVHDGDSMRVQRADGAVVTIRIYGIDCPEIGQPYGKEARDLTRGLLLGKTVEVTPAQKSKSYGRQVASIMPTVEAVNRLESQIGEVRGDLRAQCATLDGLRQQTQGINRGLEMLNSHLLEKGL